MFQIMLRTLRILNYATLYLHFQDNHCKKDKYCHTCINSEFDFHRALHHNIISIIKPTRCTSVSNLFYFGMTLYMFRKVFPSIIRSSRPYIRATGICQTDTAVCLQASKQADSIICTVEYSNRDLSNRYCSLLPSKQIAVSVWQMPFAVCMVLNCWWWMERPSETCRVRFLNKINVIHTGASSWFYYRNCIHSLKTGVIIWYS